MRFFAASSQLFDQFRTMVMTQLGMPNQYADEPWQEGVTSLALGSHHYEPEEYAAMIEAALEMGVVEITEEEYRAAQPTEEQNL